ncbi:argininosuccinate lyase [Salinisphaera hydrothermalis]|uniref:Argininosuccinate lyase n=1 Tax=Salinisphaera hydrothermalis (strain C41B8) TaxID=1304275 RepID=A0A084IPN3_SALHC|nr:argininosuccinate lyase [Salinisphaera hydrothermalis]KEZ78667.1 argininosuccinate lyase [Salinisphaera hydrothermalis C41B8]
MSEDRRISRERLEGHPGEIYTRTILKPSYDFMLEHYFEGLIQANKAWTVMLAERDIIPEDTAAGLLDAIRSLEADGRDGMGEFDPQVEYFYSTMERYLIARVGETIAGDINIGRTRPEPLVRIVMRDRLIETMRGVLALREQLLALAEAHRDTVMPLGTHMQHAQITTLGHYLVGMINALERDLDRLLAAWHRCNFCTLGCGALAGSSYDIDRDRVAELLGFEGLIENTNDCVGAGDYMLESVAALANLMTTVSRLCQDFYIWHTQEFGYISIGDDYSGSSSMMPQKKNPYPFEYSRFTATHVIGEMTGAFASLHNVNYQDTKDVEEGLAPPVFRALSETTAILDLLTGVFSTVEVDAEAMKRQAARHFASCTELAAVIHRATDLSFRSAHRIVGNLVLRAIRQGKDATQVDAALVNESAQDVLGRDLPLDDAMVSGALDPESFVQSHTVKGGPAREPLQAALAEAGERARADRERVDALADGLDTADTTLNTAVEQWLQGRVA